LRRLQGHWICWYALWIGLKWTENWQSGVHALIWYNLPKWYIFHKQILISCKISSGIWESEPVDNAR
jgi:hypothetical protein